ncbi:MAG: hypothetical protein FJ100_08155 [Deltaproteobacteria bacterium]|nr:hypothetical protein [Deltaproteobacteria bacterium]
MAARAVASLFACVLAHGCGDGPEPGAAVDASPAAETALADVAPLTDALRQADGSTAEATQTDAGSPADASDDAPVEAATEVGVAADVLAADAAPDAATDAMTEVVEPADGVEELGPDAAPDDVPIGPPKPEPAVIGPPVSVTVQVLYTGAVGFAVAAEGAQVLAQAGTQTVLAVDPEVPPVQLGGAPGKIHAAAVFSPGQLLVASDTGLYGAVKGKLLVSPLQAIVGSPPLDVFAHTAAGKPWLWVVAKTGVWRHDGAVAQPLQVQGQQAAQLAAAVWRAGPDVAIDSASGAPKSGGKPTPALWLYLQGAVQALVLNGNTGNLWVDEAIAGGLDLRCDGAGTVWLRAADGTVHRRAADGTWQWLALPEAVTALVARPDLPVAALQTPQGFWLHQDGAFFPVTATAGWQLRDLTATGALVATGAAGVARMVPGEVKPPPPPSWAATIEPIYKARCANCHGPTAVTVKLHTAQLWQQWYAKILVQLGLDAMPLLPPKLSEQDKALVKAWGKGGFAP